MNKLEAQKRIDTLVPIINNANIRYHVDDSPEITDSQFDTYYSELKSIERLYPELIAIDSPTQNVGGKKNDSRFKKVTHTRNMISLENAYEDQSIKSWYTKTCKDAEQTELNLHGEYKLDGLALSLKYINGVLALAATRGRDNVGEDITDSVLQMKAIPAVLDTANPPTELEVRGEAFFTLSQFKEINQYQQENNLKIFKNPRNSVAGTLRNLDTTIVSRRQPSFIAYTAFSGDPEFNSINSNTARLNKLEEFGFKIQSDIYTGKDLDGLLEAMHKFYKEKNQLDLPTDGYVIKIDDISVQERLGSTAKTPRWALAAKPPTEEVVTQLISIDEQVSRLGVITPVANLTPVNLGGVTVSRATLHNYNEISRLNIKLGDFAFIKKGGEIIPGITKVDTSRYNPNTMPILPPKTCPTCGGVVKQEGKVFFACISGIACASQATEKMIHFASRDFINIQDFGASAIEALYGLGKLKTFSDIYKLTKEDLSAVPNFKSRKIERALDSINRSRKCELDKLIGAIGIPGVGKGKSTVLANHFGSIDKLSKATLSEISNIQDFSEILARNILSFFSNPTVKNEIDKLLLELNVSHTPSTLTHLKGKSFVVTGSFESIKRQEIEGKIKAAGGKVTNPSSKTNFLVLGEGGGSKHTKVLELIKKGVEIKIINEQEIKELIF